MATMEVSFAHIPSEAAYTFGVHGESFTVSPPGKADPWYVDLIEDQCSTMIECTEQPFSVRTVTSSGG